MSDRTSTDRPLEGLALMLAASASFVAMNALTAALGRHGVPWELASFARASVGFFVALAIARARGRSLSIDNHRVLWTRSFAGSTSMLLTFFSLTHMPLADATALLNTTPLWIALLAWFTMGERPGRSVVAALVVAIVGVWFVQQPTFERGQWVGFVALTAGATSALSMVSLRRLHNETPEAVVVHFSAVASGFTLLAVLARLGREHALRLPRSPFEWLMVIGVGFTATLGQLTMTRAYSLDRAARVGAAGWAQIIFALLLDGALRSRWPERSASIGISMLLGAGALLLFGALREQRRASHASS
jgi:drug/metabolite transporter (DMT)-like permease